MFTRLCLSFMIAIATAQLPIPAGGTGASKGGQVLINMGQDTLTEEVPWHAAIYKQQNTTRRYRLQCGGTLVAANLIITAAHCFCDAACPSVNASKYRVALGKYYSAYDNFDSSHVQQFDVKEIVVQSRYRGEARNYEYDVAVMELRSSARLTSTVQLARLDWRRSLASVLASGVEGVVAGWGSSAYSPHHSEALQSIRLPTVDQGTCFDAAPGSSQHLITHGKFCAGFVNSSRSLCPGDSGGGFVVRSSDTEALLLGVVSANLQPGGYNSSLCYADHYAVFIDLTDQVLLDWIRSLHPTLSTTVAFTTPAQLCPAMLSDEYFKVRRCRKDGVAVSCAQPMRVGSTAMMRCQAGLISSSNSSTWTATCGSDAKWIQQQPTCRRQADECGSRDSRKWTVAGETVTSEQPWFIAIYNDVSTSTDLVYKTTGTLITTTHVVTAAWVVSDSGGTAYPASLMHLIAGKHLRDYDVTESKTQTRNVTSVILHGQFNYDSAVHDIALLVADKPFTMTWNVNIACVDWSDLLQAPTPGQRVLTAGVRDGVSTSSKVFASQPAVFVSHEECRTSSWEDQRRFLSADDLCARTTSNITCNTLPGTGLLVERTTSRGAGFFLVGVLRRHLSFGFANDCFFNRLESYTPLSTHASWIRRHIDLT